MQHAFYFNDWKWILHFSLERRRGHGSHVCRDTEATGPGETTINGPHLGTRIGTGDPDRTSGSTDGNGSSMFFQYVQDGEGTLFVRGPRMTSFKASKHLPLNLAEP